MKSDVLGVLAVLGYFGTILNFRNVFFTFSNVLECLWAFFCKLLFWQSTPGIHYMVVIVIVVVVVDVIAVAVVVVVVVVIVVVVVVVVDISVNVE